MHLMRVLPPRQLGSFMNGFDQLLKSGFERLLGIPIEERWWRLSQLPPKFGGMALRSGLKTHGAQHLCSLAKSADNVDRIVGGWDVVALAKQETECWLNNACDESINIEVTVNELRNRGKEEANDGVACGLYRYSLSQLCELNEQKSVSKLMSIKERLHIEAHSGQSHAWVTLLPLSFKRYNLSSTDWVAAARRRLMLNVFPSQKHCNFCKGGWCDVKGDHATMCGGGSSKILRHNNMRNIIAKAARDVGFNTDIEHGGGLGDQRRPGDVIVYNWRDGRHLLIDVAVINPMCTTNIDSLISDGVGGAAAAYGNNKERKYHDLDRNRYEFLPFIMETTGGLSEAAVGFCKEIKKHYESSICHSDFDCPKNYEINWLQSALSVELQRANSRMVLERTPLLEDLIETAMVKCELAVSKKKEIAIENLRLGRLRPDRIHKNKKKGPDCENLQYSPMKRSSKRWSAPKKVDAKSSKCLKKMKKKRENLFNRKGICPKGGTMQLGKEITSETPPLNPEPPEAWKNKSAPVTIDWRDEERILASKSNTSQNTSTSSVPRVFPRDSFEDIRKKVRGRTIINKKSGASLPSPTLVDASTSHLSTEREEMEKIPWDPPSIRIMHQE